MSQVNVSVTKEVKMQTMKDLSQALKWMCGASEFIQEKQILPFDAGSLGIVSLSVRGSNVLMQFYIDDEEQQDSVLWFATNTFGIDPMGVYKTPYSVFVCYPWKNFRVMGK